MNGFEIVESKRSPIVEQNKKVSEKKTNKNKSSSANNKAMDIVANNFDSIMKCATDIIDIKKMQVQSDAVLAKMKEDRENLLAEAEVYAMKKNADTNNIVQRMNVIRGMMQDFYAQSNQQITGEDFRLLITEIVNQMGRVENGN